MIKNLASLGWWGFTWRLYIIFIVWCFAWSAYIHFRNQK